MDYTNKRKKEMLSSVNNEIENIRNEIYRNIKNKIMEFMIRGEIEQSSIYHCRTFPLKDENIFPFYWLCRKIEDFEWVKQRLEDDGFEVSFINPCCHDAKMKVEWK